jgi:hypothetical protein
VLFSADNYNNLTILQQHEFIDIFSTNKHLTLTTYLTDAYHVIIFPHNHPYYILTAKHLKYWEKWFGNNRTGQHIGLV